MKDLGDNISGKKITISGSGNVAQFAGEKCLELGGIVLTFSDSAGTIFEVSCHQSYSSPFIYSLIFFVLINSVVLVYLL